MLEMENYFLKVHSLISSPVTINIAMLNLPVYLYTPVIRVFLDLENSTNRGVDIMYHGYAKLAKGVKNTIQFNFLNGDQRPISVSTKTFVFKMFDYSTNKEVVSQNLQVLDDGTTLSLRGKTQLTLTSAQLPTSFKTGMYTYSLLQVNNTELLPVYIDGASDMHGKIEIVDGVIAKFIPSDELTFLTNQNDVYTAGPISTNRDGKGNNGLHTIQLYMTGFTGTLEIGGSLANEPPATFDQFTVLQTESFVNETDTVGLTIPDLDNIKYLMFRYTKSSGAIDKVLYRS
jgi:hypothetical protein